MLVGECQTSSEFSASTLASFKCDNKSIVNYGELLFLGMAQQSNHKGIPSLVTTYFQFVGLLLQLFPRHYCCKS